MTPKVASSSVAKTQSVGALAVQPPMVRLIYKSASEIPFSRAELNYLVIRARQNNQPRGIVGMLIHADGLFLQIIEGASDAVEKLFGKISIDHRHGEVQVLMKISISAPLFDDWSMGFLDATKDELVIFADRIASWDGRSGGDQALEALMSLRQRASSISSNRDPTTDR